MDIKYMGPFVFIIICLMPVNAVDFTLIDCEPVDEITQSGSEYTFTSTVPDYAGCRAVADSTVPDTPTSYYNYTITADVKPGTYSTPGIIFNVAGAQDFDMILFRTSEYNCVLRATMAGGIYTEDTDSGTHCSGYRVFDNQWFQVQIKVYQTTFSISINEAFNLEFPTDHPRLAKYGFIHGYGYEGSCNYDCSFQFRVPDITPESELIERLEQEGTLESPDYGNNNAIPYNKLYHYRLHLDRVGQQGTACFLAFFIRDLDIGTANLTIHDDDTHLQGQIRMYSIAAGVNIFDVYFSTGLIDSSKRGFQILYQVFSCSADSPDLEDLDFLCTDGNYNNLHGDFYRSTAYTSDPADYKADSSLSMGWYRFSSCVGGSIPTTDPGTNDVCGTKNPIYIQGYQTQTPLVTGTYSGTSCVSSGGGCTTRWDTPVYVCPDFELYYLVPTPEESGYCAGSEVTCASQGTASLGGDDCDPCSNDPHPELSGKPTIGTWIYGGVGVYNLDCNINGPDDLTLVEFEVEWIVEDTRNVIQHKEHITTSIDSLPSNLILKEHLQSSILCRVRANFEGKPEHGPWVESAPYFIGIRPMEEFKEIEEADIYNLRFELTMPITCSNGVCMDPDDANCFLDVYLLTETKHLTRHGCANVIYKEPELLHLRSCSTTVSCKNWNIKQTQIVKAKETMMIGVPSYTHTVFIVTKDIRGMWDNTVSRAQIRINMESSDSHLTSMCTVRNDPHITTFEGSQYDTHLPGEYLLHRSTPFTDRNMELVVTGSVEKCSGGTTGPGCNTGIGVRIVDEAVIIRRDQCPRHSYITAGTGNVLPGLILTETNDFKNYQVYLPRGEVILINSQWRFLTITVDSPREKQHRNTQHGLCGKIFEGGQKNKGDADLLFRNGTAYPKTFLKWADLHDFSPDWQATTGEALISKTPLFQAPNSTTVDYYTCSLHDVNDFLLGNHVGVFEAVLDKERCAPYKRPNLLEEFRRIAIGGRKRSCTSQFTQKRKISTSKRNTTNEVWTEESALAYCHSYIAESPIGEACQSVVPDIDGVVQQCAIDIMLTNSTDWSADTLTSLREICVFNTYQNLNIWPPEIDESTDAVVLQPPVYILNNVCPSNCTNHGACVEASCECSDGYIGYDCSLSIDTPPTLTEIADGDICYKDDDCDELVVFGENFVNSDQLTCHFWMDEETGDGSAIPNAQAVMLDTDLVACPYPTISTIGSSHIVFTIAISNDGVHRSEVLKAARMHNECILCNHTEDMTIECHVKGGMCLIDERCILANDTSTDNNCLFCDPEDAPYSWTKQTDCDHESSLPTWVYIVAAIGGVVIIVIIIVVAVICCRKARRQ